MITIYLIKQNLVLLELKNYLTIFIFMLLYGQYHLLIFFVMNFFVLIFIVFNLMILIFLIEC